MVTVQILVQLAGILGQNRDEHANYRMSAGYLTSKISSGAAKN